MTSTTPREATLDAKLQELAGRVEKEPASRTLDADVAGVLGIAVDYEVGCYLPHFTTNLDAVKMLEDGCLFAINSNRDGDVFASIFTKEGYLGTAYTKGEHAEPRARLAAFLRAMISASPAAGEGNG